MTFKWAQLRRTRGVQLYFFRHLKVYCAIGDLRLIFDRDNERERGSGLFEGSFVMLWPLLRYRLQK